jgi:hypothetical protein
LTSRRQVLIEVPPLAHNRGYQCPLACRIVRGKIASGGIERFGALAGLSSMADEVIE